MMTSYITTKILSTCASYIQYQAVSLLPQPTYGTKLPLLPIHPIYDDARLEKVT